jgi:hypothetical protein
MGADALIDFAVLDSAAAAVETPTETQTTEVETPVEGSETQTTEVETPVEGSETQTTETESTNADGSEKTEEEKVAFKEKEAKAKADKSIDTKATPENVRKALKAMRDSNPANAAVAKELHGAYERFNAYKAEFSTVTAAKEAKAFIESVGGPEGYQKMQEALDSVTAVDEMLYAADSKIWDNVIEDLKANGHPEALGELAPAFLEKLKAHDVDAFYNTTIPVVANALKEVHMDSFVSQFNAALAEKNDKGEVVPNVAKITSLVKSITDWYNDLNNDAKTRTTTPTETPERKKFLAEKAAFEKTKADATTEDRKKFESGVAEECEKKNNISLGKILGGFLKMPFFKDFPYETKVDLGNGIKERLYAALKADNAYQTMMSGMWKQKTPDRAKIVQYHEAKLNSIATDIVTKTIQARYPNYAKGGSAAGKAAAATVKKETAAKAATQSVNTGKPIYVASRPTNLVRDPIKVGGKDYTSSDLVTLQITGRGFVKTPDGKSVKFVTWRH